MSELAINATEWRSADWAKRNGLYADVFDNEADLDKEIERLSQQLAKSNPEAMQLLKKVFWQGTDHWNELLIERAEISGKLVLSEFTRNAINAFKKK
jgi:methylglutaconyl-CoA hydratase